MFDSKCRILLSIGRRPQSFWQRVHQREDGSTDALEVGVGNLLQARPLGLQRVMVHRGRARVELLVSTSPFLGPVGTRVKLGKQGRPSAKLLLLLLLQEL